jgi:1-deoxy-D-xylulose-5-phosphate reductoisomerase
VNKALEVIEAHFLFDAGYDQVTAVVHPQSIIHSFVEFTDGSVLAQLGFPNMELPILYALTHPDRLPDDGTVRFDPLVAGSLTFEPIRTDVFPAFGLGVAAGKAGGTAPTAFNAANEVAVEAFLAGRIAFGKIAGVIDATLQAHDGGRPADSLEAVRDADAEARSLAQRALGSAA